MRILVVGAGATGGYFGARLLQAGRDVTFLVRARRAGQLAEHGLRVKSPHGDLHIATPPVVLPEQIAAPYDVVLLSCKAYDLAGAMDSITPAVGPDTVIVPLLNGMRHLDQLDARFGAARVMGGRCMISSTLDDQGTILHLSAFHILSFGERPSGNSPRAQALAEVFGNAGFDVQRSDAMLQDMWEKWFFLATLAASTCLMRATIGDILAAPRGRETIAALLDECAAIAAANGYPVREPAMQQARTTLFTEGSPITASMLRDVERGAAIESDQIVGDLLARRGSTDAPTLAMALTHLKAYEARRARGG
ncbi:2-dehydropantoate 2-reductase [Cupriavidus sp. U2]|uniref:2-dehydropantoate 2-reductase n=1 Tax=Cupriavidus sp. U2 TaxID=2920269 RepID=UPI00129E7F28|nr:2-dehydropantoate 2-reductase [Cupriavidus sp. U2]KAI3593725.1 2-dehydropantoate 2-reductase [Cupriavidus sp. U2]